MNLLLKSKNTSLRLEEIDDAVFIISLRTDEKHNKHLSHVNNDIIVQRE